MAQNLPVYPVMKIAKLQFESLLRSPVTYVLLDLRTPETSPKFLRSVFATAESAYDLVKVRIRTMEDPIVVICEDGLKSSQVAEQLSKAGHKNVVLLDGGVANL